MYGTLYLSAKQDAKRPEAVTRDSRSRHRIAIQQRPPTYDGAVATLSSAREIAWLGQFSMQLKQ